MYKILPIIIISSTIPLSENIIILQKDYSHEAYEATHKNSSDNITITETPVDHKPPPPTIP